MGLNKKKIKSQGRSRTQEYHNDALENRNLLKEFVREMKGMTENAKLRWAYSKLSGTKPDTSTSREQMLNRIIYELRYGSNRKETKLLLELQNALDKKKKGIKGLKVKKSVLKKSLKARDMVLVQHLNIKGEEEPLRLYPMYGGNMVILKSIPHEVDPRAFWRFGKYKKLIIKQIDRRPVSNLDYDEIRARGDATDSDEFLIKAALKAFVGGVKKKMGKGALIVIGIIVVAIVIGMFALS